MESKKRLLRRFKIVLYSVFFPLIIFQGCVTKEAVKNGPDEEILRERAKVYWEHKIKHEFDKSYEFEAPVYRKKVNLVNYIRGFNVDVVKWNDAMIEDIKVEGASAVIDMNLRVKVKVPEVKPFEYNSLVKEKWVKVEGIWYHVPAEL